MTLNSKLQETVLVVTLVVSLSAGTLFMAPVVRAESNREEMLAQIQQLLTLIASLQQKLLQRDGSSNTISKNFAIGDRVATTDRVNFRYTPGGVLINSVPANTGGKVTKGLQWEGAYKWYFVEYDNGDSGRTAANWLTGIESTLVSPVSKPIDQGYVQIDSLSEVMLGQTAEISVTLKNYNWDPQYRYIIHFGDGAAGIVSKEDEYGAYDTFEHTYKKAGSYSITVTYTDWGSTDPNNDIYGVAAMKDVNHKRNVIVATKKIKVSEPEEHTSFWDTNDDQVYIVGVYEGLYPDGQKHSYGYHPQGEVELVIDNHDGQLSNTMLVLSSYEPVEWKLEGDGLEHITRVFLTGYYDQEITGLSRDVEVIHASHQSGDEEYFYAYEQNSKELDKLQTYIAEKSGRDIRMYWWGAYSPKYGSYIRQKE